MGKVKRSGGSEWIGLDGAVGLGETGMVGVGCCGSWIGAVGLGFDGRACAGRLVAQPVNRAMSKIQERGRMGFIRF